MKPAPTITSRAPGRSALGAARARRGGRAGEHVVEPAQQAAALAAPRRSPRAGGRSAARRRRRARPPARRASSAGRPRRRGAARPRCRGTRRRRAGAARLALAHAGEQLLGQRRAVVGRDGLGADHPHRPVVALAAQRLGEPLRRRGRRRRSRPGGSSTPHPSRARRAPAPGRRGAARLPCARRNRPAIGTAEAARIARIHGVDASVPAVSAWIAAEQPDDDGDPVGLAPEPRADPPARVEAQPEQRGEVAGDDPEAGRERPEAHREGHADAASARGASRGRRAA